MRFPSDFESKIKEVLRNITEAQNPNFKIYRFEVKCPELYINMEMGGKLTTSQIVLSIFSVTTVF